MVIDYVLLQKQRNVLLTVPGLDGQESAILGVVSLLEALLDEAIDRGEIRISEDGDVLPLELLPSKVVVADNDPSTMR